MLKLKVVSPERVEFEGDVTSVTVPGSGGSFEILTDHAPIISSLDSGIVEYVTPTERKQLAIGGGFVEVQKNQVSLCVELNEE
ncbi:MAG: ATP synthase F1 subunit epsilon [Prevotella sp.]|nr:ATP synthase F1 subunit epsilon [Prevotella sp.]MBQ9650937.1 ATP synthase F1 subunit epsilon [Prevotella sp.]